MCDMAGEAEWIRLSGHGRSRRTGGTQYFRCLHDSVGDAEGAQAKAERHPDDETDPASSIALAARPTAFPKGFSEPSTGICQAMYAAVAETCEDTILR